MVMHIGTDNGVQTTHAEYNAKIDDWNRVDNVINGDVGQYLRKVGAGEKNPDVGKRRQSEYEDGAILYNFTLHTKNGMQGAIFNRPPDIDIPDALDYVNHDVDGNSVSVQQQSREAVDQVARKGRAGVFADMPASPAGGDGESRTLSMAEAFEPEWLPRLQLYVAQDIINWKTRRFGSVVKLSLIVLREAYEEPVNDDMFYTETYYQYRVLGLDDDGYYYQEVYTPDVSGQVTSYNKGGRSYPRQGGKKMRHIPFYFIGSEFNNFRVDAAPLLPIADLNIGHFRNSADTEENSFIASQAMLIINLTGMDKKEFAESNPGGVQAGSRRGLIATDAKYIQADESDKAMKLMQIKEEQAQKIGAQLINQSAQVTAETARIQNAANTSVLATMSHNVGDAYTMGLKDLALFLGQKVDGIQFKLSDDFFVRVLTAQERAQWIAEVTAGVMPVTEYYAALRRSGEIHKTNKEIQREINKQDEMMLLGGGLYEQPKEAEAEEDDQSNSDKS